MVSLGYQESKNDVQRWNHICEGSILSDRTIITSGDCLDYINEDMIIKDVETKLQIRVGDEDFNNDHDDDSDEDDDKNDDDDDVKFYFADGFRKHESNVALIATNESMTRVNSIGLPEEDISYEKEIHKQPADLAMWNEDGELEERSEVDLLWYRGDHQNYAYAMKTCRGKGASMIRTMEGKPVILIGILGKDPTCENEVDKDNGKFQRKFAKVAHPEVLKFIKDSKKDLELCQSLKDCFCELRDLRC